MNESIQQEHIFPSIGHIEPYVFRRPEYPDSLFWTIVVSCPGPGSDQAELSAAGWQNVELSSPEIRLCASSQLACSLLLADKVWAPAEDLRYAQQYPILLAFQTSSFANEVETLGSLEHMVLGSAALVLHADKCFLYHLNQLENAATALSQAIQGGIDIFASSSLVEQEKMRPVDPYEYEHSLRQQQHQQAHVHWAETHQAAKELARLYWQLHQRQQKTTSLPKGRSTLRPVAFQQRSVAAIPASLALQSALAAYSNAQSHQASGWKQEQNRLFYPYERSSKEYAHVEWRPGISPAMPTDVEFLWSKIRLFDDRDGDVLLCLLAHWLAASKDPEGYVWISSELMLSYRGIRPRSYVSSDGVVHNLDYRQDEIAAISTSVEHIRNTHVTLQQQIQEEAQPKRRGRPRKRVLQLESYLVTITDFLQQDTLFAENEITDRVAVAWRYRPGNCIEAFLDQQFTALFQKSLNYDPLREQWEKRLSRYFMFHLYGGQKSTITRMLGDIIDELSLPVNKSDPMKTRKHLEKAMLHLQEDRQIGGWCYSEDLADLPSHHWFKVWRSYHIEVQASVLPVPSIRYT